MLLGTLPEKDFFGRREDLAHLYNLAIEAEKGISQNICVSGPGGVGKTELLKQLFNQLFWGQSKVAPFYYVPNNALLSSAAFARDYLIHFICQRLAFDLRDVALLNTDSISIENLESIIGEKKAGWAQKILERYLADGKEPTDALRIALNAPYQSTLTTDIPVVVMIDEFQRLNNLNINGKTDPLLASLFEKPMSFKKAQYLISGNQTEVMEMPVTSHFSKIDLGNLRLDGSSKLFSAVCEAYGVKKHVIPYALINRLGGNPFYIRCIAKTAGINKKFEEGELWKAYTSEVCSGGIYVYWSSKLKNFLHEPNLRKDALEALSRIYEAEGSFPYQKILKMISPDNALAERVVTAIYRAGFITGEYGVFGRPEDKVLMDFVRSLYLKEISGLAYPEIEKRLLEEITEAESPKDKGIIYEMTIPRTRDAELVAAQCLEQIGRNLHLDEESIGQMQMAVIEACINAIEYGSKEDNKIYLGFRVTEDNSLEASIESAGKEFIAQETGEPFMGRGMKEDAGRGWGIKLMKKFADSVRFEKTGRGIKVILVKSLQKSTKMEEDISASE